MAASEEELLPKEEKLCQAKCRDESCCLNKAKYGRYCWRHCP